MRTIHALIGVLFCVCATPALAYDETGNSTPYEVAPTTQTAMPVAAHSSRHARHNASAPSLVGSPSIVAEAAHYIGSRNPTGFRGPWCKAFVNMVGRHVGIYVNGSFRARDTSGLAVGQVRRSRKRKLDSSDAI